MILPSVKEIPYKSKIILRMDTDLPIENGIIIDNYRLKKSIPTISLMLNKKCKIVVVGHRGRPEGKDSKLSLYPVYVELISLAQKEIGHINSVFIENIKDTESIKTELERTDIVFLENARFWKEEEEGDVGLFEDLTKECRYFVNDAFAVAHRKNASMMLYKQTKAYYGLAFIEEAKKISQVLEKPKKPIVVVLGGAKEDKLKFLNRLVEKADYILIGGKLPKIIKDIKMELPKTDKIIVASLDETGFDISNDSINKFKEVIESAKTIVWAGAMGYYEDKNHRKGTEEVARAITENKGFKIIAGGDTGASIKNLNLDNKIDFICSGGGVMLQYLGEGTLPAWE